MKNTKITFDYEITGTVYPCTIDIAKEINKIDNVSLRTKKTLDILNDIDLSGNLFDFFIADYRKKMIELNLKFKFDAIEETSKDLLGYYLEKLDTQNYINLDEIYENYVKSLKK
jgi:hypothetical protein